MRQNRCQSKLHESGYMKRHTIPNLVFVAWLCLAAVPARGAADLTWNTNKGLVTANMRSARLDRVLEKISRATGWRIFVEPGPSDTISTRFSDLPSGEALRRLLGDMNFALVPATNGHPKLFVFRTAMQNATQAVPTTATLLANELVVKLKPGVKIDDVAKMLRGKVIGRVDGLNLYRLQFEDESAAASARRQLSTLTEVASVENNYALEQPPDVRQLSGSGVPSLSLQLKPPPPGGRIIVGLIDTAVQPLGQGLDAFLLKPISVAGPPDNSDPNFPTHGTTMAETMLRSLQAASKGATSVQILPVDVYGPSPSTSTFDVANGIVQAVNAGAQVINLSLGSEVDSPMLRDVVETASQKGIQIYAAAGNEPVTTPFYPAAYPEVMAVTAVDNGQVAPYANRGSFISLGAPGSSVVYFKDQPYYVTGTSAASAFTSGLAAGYMEATGSGAQQTRDFLKNTYGLTPGTPGR